MEGGKSIYAIPSLLLWCSTPGICRHFSGPESCERINGEHTSEVRGGFLWMAVSEIGSRNSAGVFEELLGGVC